MVRLVEKWLGTKKSVILQKVGARFCRNEQLLQLDSSQTMFLVRK